MQVYPVHSSGNALEQVRLSYLEMPRAQQTGLSASSVSIDQPFKNVSQGTPRLKIPQWLSMAFDIKPKTPSQNL